MVVEKDLGFKSVFNFVPEDRYFLPASIRTNIQQNGFDIGVHGLNHDGKLFRTFNGFKRQAQHINRYLYDWGVKGFSSPSMLHNLDWMHLLDIEYSTSTFDTDPFEPQPDGIQSIFPLLITSREKGISFVEIPLTMVQDFTLFVILQEKSTDIWKHKLDWIAQHGGMVVLNTHPDYMCFSNNSCGREEYPVELYSEFISYVKREYEGTYWHAVPSEIAQHVKSNSKSDCK